MSNNMSNNTVVGVRINNDVKTEAMEVLEAMGLTVSEAIRLFLLRVAEEKHVKAPDVATARAMKELKDGGGARYGSVEEMFKDSDV